MAEFVSPAEFSRRIGVSKQAVGKAIRVGRVPVYDESGARVEADYSGRKFVRPEEAAKQFKLSRARIDDDALSEIASEVERDISLDLQPPPSPVASTPADEGSLSPSPSLVSAKTENEAVRGEIMRMRLARERGDLVSRQAQLDAFETAGRGVARAWQVLPTWAEEIAGILHAGGVPELTAWLRRKAAEQCDGLADLFSGGASDEADDAGDPDDD